MVIILPLQTINNCSKAQRLQASQGLMKHSVEYQEGPGCYLLPPEELLEEVVRLRLSAPISLLTRVSRSVDILFLRERRGVTRS